MTSWISPCAERMAAWKASSKRSSNFSGVARRDPRYPDSMRGLLGVAISFAVCLLAASLPGCKPSDDGESFVPGLCEIMTLTQMRHLKLWFAGEAENWDLAAYETDELVEGFEDIVHFHPTHKMSPVPLTQIVPQFTNEPVRALRSAIEHRDRA